MISSIECKATFKDGTKFEIGYVISDTTDLEDIIYRLEHFGYALILRVKEKENENIQV